MYCQSAETFNIKAGGTCPHTLRMVSTGVSNTSQSGIFNSPIKSGVKSLETTRN